MFRIKQKKKEEDLALHAGDHCRADVGKLSGYAKKAKFVALLM